MTNFADVLVDLVATTAARTCAGWRSANEPNSGGLAAVSLAEYEVLVRDSRRAAREPAASATTSGSMGPGLIENAGVPTRTHCVWMQWIAANMSDLFDACSEHVYWDY